MNIFILSRNPRKAAQYHCDKHVVKMILETTQLLYSAVWLANPISIKENAYKLTHKNHPCAIWVRSSRDNYNWLCRLGLWLCFEYNSRYGKVHKSQDHLMWLSDNIPTLPDNGLTPFVQAMPETYKNEDAVIAYRTFYIESKIRIRNIVKYNHSDIPKFLKNVL